MVPECFRSQFTSWGGWSVSSNYSHRMIAGLRLFHRPWISRHRYRHKSPADRAFVLLARMPSIPVVPLALMLRWKHIGSAIVILRLHHDLKTARFAPINSGSPTRSARFLPVLKVSAISEHKSGLL